MQHRRLGRTGHHGAVAVLGGAAFWGCSPEEAADGFAACLEAGVDHPHIAPSYGRAELLLGPLVARVRDRLFVAGKTGRRNGAGVRAQLEETLRRLGTDHLDLYQMHAVTDLATLDERTAAAETILAARDEGLVRFVGITGHDIGTPAAQLEAVRRYDLDTVMFPVFPRVWAEPGYRAAAEALLDVAAERDLGVMAIKAVARRPWRDRPRTHDCWYEPHTDPGAVTAGVRFALSTPGVHAFCTPGDLRVLPLALAAADAFSPMSGAERDAAVAAADDELIFPMADKAPAH